MCQIFLFQLLDFHHIIKQFLQHMSFYWANIEKDEKNKQLPPCPMMTPESSCLVSREKKLLQNKSKHYYSVISIGPCVEITTTPWHLFHRYWADIQTQEGGIWIGPAMTHVHDNIDHTIQVLSKLLIGHTLQDPAPHWPEMEQINHLFWFSVR